jgi:hypothetical protein
MSFGKVLIVMGFALMVLGGLWLLSEKAGLGRLPGDILIRRKHFTFYFPLVTCFLLSALLSLVLWLLGRWRQ